MHFVYQCTSYVLNTFPEMLYCHNWFSLLEILRETRISISQWQTVYSKKEEILTRILYYMYIVQMIQLD